MELFGLIRHLVADMSPFLCSFDVDAKMGEVWPVKCRFVVREILQTEIAYVRSLSDIVKVRWVWLVSG